jgi:hypothetical protein
MALGTNHVTKTTADKFIPEIWSDEIIAAYKKNLVAANLFSKMSFKGKKGDTLHIPKPTRGDASLKAASSQVTLIAATETEVQVLINKHYEYSRLIEDIVEVQALASLRKFYTDDAGYALALRVDTDLLNMGTAFGVGNTDRISNAIMYQTPNMSGFQAGIGYSYDAQRDAFISPQPYPSWILDEQTCFWNTPVPKPTMDGKMYRWDEPTLAWVQVISPDATPIESAI